MAKLSYILSKSTKHNGKTSLNFDGSGSGNWFQKVFKKDYEEVLTPASEVRDLISKLNIEFNGDGESNFETKIELEGTTEELKEFAGWSIGYIKANADFLKDLADFIRKYFDTLADEAVKIMKCFAPADVNANKAAKEAAPEKEKNSDK